MEIFSVKIIALFCGGYSKLYLFDVFSFLTSIPNQLEVLRLAAIKNIPSTDEKTFKKESEKSGKLWSLRRSHPMTMRYNTKWK